MANNFGNSINNNNNNINVVCNVSSQLICDVLFFSFRWQWRYMINAYILRARRAVLLMMFIDSLVLETVFRSFSTISRRKMFPWLQSGSLCTRSRKPRTVLHTNDAKYDENPQQKLRVNRVNHAEVERNLNARCFYFACHHLIVWKFAVTEHDAFVRQE